MKRYTVSIYQDGKTIQHNFDNINDAIACAEKEVGSSIMDNLAQTVYNYGEFEELKSVLLMG